MNTFLLIILFLYIILSPFYIFPSGLPQPADFIVAFGGFIFLFSPQFWKTFNERVVKKLFYFVLLVFVINYFYFLYYELFLGVENNMYFSAFFYIYNFLFFIISFYVLNGIKRVYIHNFISFAIIFSISLQFIISILGIGDTAGVRGKNFFNNPNQLGYYILILTSLFVVIPNKFKNNIYITLSTMFFSIYLVLISGSRGALVGVFVLFIIIFLKESFKFNVKSILFIFLFLIAGNYFIQTEFYYEQVSSITNRHEAKPNDALSEVTNRAYNRILENPEYLLYGAGEGLFGRFGNSRLEVTQKLHSGLELHSGISTILFSYGILGFFLFFSFLYYIIKQKFWINLIILSPVMLYNMTHQGFRTSLLWLLFASIYVITKNENEANKNFLL